MSHRALSVEFVGMPASGKSALSHRVAEILTAGGVGVEQPSWVLAHDISYPARWMRKSAIVGTRMARRPGDLLETVGAIRATSQYSGMDTMRMTFNWLLVRALMERPRVAGSVRLFDQGVLQALWSIGLGGKAGAITQMARHLDGAIPIPDVVVFVTASPGAVRRRLELRPGQDSRIERRLSGRKDEAILERGTALFEEVIRVAGEWRKDHGVPVVVDVVNDWDDGLDRTASMLAARLQLLFTPR